MREASKILAMTAAALAPLFGYIRCAQPETPIDTYGWVFAGYSWGVISICCYLLLITRNHIAVKRRVKLDEVADRVIEVELPGDHLRH